MTDFYQESECARCIRSSSLSSLWGFLLCILGGGSFCASCILSTKRLEDVFPDTNSSVFPWILRGTYILISAYIVYSISAYLLAAFTNGWNGRHYFEGSKRVQCGRCLTMTMIVLHFMAILFWCALACISFYILISLLQLRNKTKDNSMKLDLSYYGLFIQDKQKPLEVNAKDSLDLLIFCSIALGGSLMTIAGYFQMAICLAVNYTRLEELRYYDNPEERY